MEAFHHFFTLHRSTKQGCPLSPLLFLVALEPLAIAIRQNCKIKGVEGGKEEHKLFLYADDILLLLREPSSPISHLMETVLKFSKISGYKVNWQKSEAMLISPSCMPEMVTSFNFKCTQSSIKYLAIIIVPDFNELVRINTMPLLQNIRQLLDKWKFLKLTLWGKINAVKMTIIPKVNYFLMILQINLPKTFFKQYNDLIRDFLWGKKKSHELVSKKY